MINKKGEEVFSLWWFFLAAVVGLTIVFIVTGYYSKPTDVRSLHGEILGNVIYNCVVNSASLRGDFLDSGFDIEKECKLNNSAMKNKDSFYYSVNVSSSEGESIKFLNGGAVNFRSDCEVALGKVKTTAKFVQCSSMKYPVTYFNGVSEQKVVVEVVSASNNYGERVSFGIKEVGLK